MKTTFGIKLLITLFAVFLAIAIPCISMFVSKKTDGGFSSDAIHLEMAIASYFTEYRKYPTRTSPPEDAENPEFSDHVLMAFLNSEREPQRMGASPRRISFVSFRAARKSDSGKYYGGVSVAPDGDLELWDPWGNHYRVVMDLDGDGTIPSPSFASTRQSIPNSVIVWSAGPDGKDATVKDNIMTWRP